ncbi:HNH endonuclease [Gloeobacter kilaueensis]|uniref:HNH endonuclease n=1 Tax=Gloeobacter kilaueensis (strain ATCC BAA-2537 / CCAP 1431/1 / ULC 316 / JS1) TaxID=1183438 RepID=U5QMV9_GLOK1|nr:HNH endonuclease [Gloeobacter kilaueensis]AGY58929.1 HNH endonuclease [Gloeobacter kilaueensis JS1]
MKTSTNVLQQPVLVLSRSYLPVGRITVREAVCLIARGKAEPVIVEHLPCWPVRSVGCVLVVPAQICLTAASVERLWKVPPVTRKELFARDGHTCQYCGAQRHLSIDHVLPRSRGGTHTWQNVVTACASCNNRKGDRTPEEAGLKLRVRPRPPVHPAITFAAKLWAGQEACVG